MYTNRDRLALASFWFSSVSKFNADCIIVLCLVFIGDTVPVGLIVVVNVVFVALVIVVAIVVVVLISKHLRSRLHRFIAAFN